MDIDTILVSENVQHDDSALGQRVLKDYDDDLASMTDWRERNEKAFQLLEHTFEGKSFPWDKAANTKIPLVLDAAIKFQSEAHGELIKGDEFVRAKIFGDETPEKLSRAMRVCAHMNYQLFFEMDAWPEDFDRKLLILPLLGCVHKKVIYDPVEKTNVSQLCVDDVVINQSATSPKRCRISQTFKLDKNAIKERERAGIWNEIDTYEPDPEGDGIEEFIEQYRRIDLDGDDYEEPYIVTVHKRSEQVVRIRANFDADDIERTGQGKVLRIVPKTRFVKYEFLPAYDGSYWGMGWGMLLGPLNDNINATINQLLDAGTLANLPSGWISASLKTKHGDEQFAPGEWKPVRGIPKDSVLPLPVNEPSQTLFALLGLLMEVGKEFTSNTDIMKGEQPHANMAASTVLALIERGKITFNSVYRRIHRAAQHELKLLFELNRQHTDPALYRQFFDADFDPRADYEDTGYDVCPVANPEFSSRVQRVAKAEALLPLADRPEINQSIIFRQYVSAIEDDQKLVEAMVPMQPNLTPQQVMEQMAVARQQMLDDLEVQKAAFDTERAEIELDMKRLEAQAKGVELPLKVAAQRAKTDQEEIGVEEARTRVELVDAQIRKAQQEPKRDTG